MGELSVLFFIGTGALGYCGTEEGTILLENESMSYIIGADGRSLGLVDKRTGKDYLAPGPHEAFITLRKDGREHKPSVCSFADGKIVVEFEELNFTATIKVGVKSHYLVFEVDSVSDEDIDEIAFLSLRVKPMRRVSGMSGIAADNEFAVCLRALNLQVGAHIGGSPPILRATCYPKYGIEGAKVALIGCPTRDLRSVLKEVVRGEGLPYSPLGGPFAMDAEENRLSYIFATVSEQNVDEWIKLAKKAGMRIVHIIGWWHTLGHYEPRSDLFPNGLEGLKTVVAKIHDAGLLAGMHTLTGFISPNDPWVSPVPDKRLAKDGAFTLAETIDEETQILHTLEPPGDLDTVWTSHSRGNVIQIDDELIQYTGLSQEPPYGFTGCKRGAFGTKAQPHRQGAPVYHLFSRWAVFFPDMNTTLVDELAERIAHVFNSCDFDMIYQDGAEVSPDGWHGVAKMREAIFSRLKGRVRVEASTWNYHSWPFHSCLGAWDHPQWAYKRFTDIHVQNLQTVREASLLPYQMGWWVIKGPSVDFRGMFPDEMEYFCVKSLAWDAPLSLQGVSPGPHPPNARQEEYLTMLGQYERLRLARYFPESVKEKLRVPGAEFHLVRGADDRWEFIPMRYATHKVTELENGISSWTVENPFSPQPVKLRIEALYSCLPYDAEGTTVIATPEEFRLAQAAEGVECAITPSTEPVKVGRSSACFTARNGTKGRCGAWARAMKGFSPPMDMSKYGAIGVWIYGDGKGELLNLQLRHPRYHYFADDEHYVDVDFEGWRYFELLLRERDAERHGDYLWPYGSIYSVYRAPLVRGEVNELNLYYNNLPPGEEVRCYLSPVKALPTVKIKLVNPSISIGDRRLLFPLTLESGQYIEFTPPDECRLYDENGALVARITPQGEVPILASGENRVIFGCDPPQGYNARAEVTLISSGEPIHAFPPSRPR
jgi:hypothetical protein